jgi:hypothetical protein
VNRESKQVPAMVNKKKEVYREYYLLKSKFDFQMFGMLEIGSYARGEAVSTSDRDIRIIIQSAEPYVVLNEHFWTKGIDVDLSYIEWDDINKKNGVTFGITNLSLIRQYLKAEMYPLSDHTAINQGCILVDEDGSIGRFRAQYAGIGFTNITQDYLEQTDWRVNHKMQKETGAVAYKQRLDKQKIAIPLIHTCFRVVRDIANIDSYQRSSHYVTDFSSLDDYYRKRWPWFYPSFIQLYAFKADEPQRRMIFTQVEKGDATCFLQLQQLKENTALLWNQFKCSVLKTRAEN